MDAMHCQVLERLVSSNECVKYSQRIALKNAASRCDSCASMYRVCPQCVTGGETKKEVKQFHFVNAGANTCEFHRRRNGTRREAQAELQEKFRQSDARKTTQPKTRKQTEAQSPPPVWLRPQMEKKHQPIGKIERLSPHKIYIPSDMPSRRQLPEDIVRISEKLRKGRQVQMVYVAPYSAAKGFSHMLLAGSDTLLAAKEIGTCIINVDVVETTGKKERFYLALMLESYSDTELGSAFRFSIEQFGATEKLLAGMFSKPVQWVESRLKHAG